MKPGRSVMFIISDILLDGRQIILTFTTPKSKLEEMSTMEGLLPGAIVPFEIIKRNKTGLIGTVFGLHATLHFTQFHSPLEITKEERATEINVRLIYLDPEKKRIVLANSEEFMAGTATAPLDRDGEKVKAVIVTTTSAGLLIKIGDEPRLGWVPRYNITEKKLEDTISHYPVGKQVDARIIDSMIGEGFHLMTMRESVVEAEFFRYDSFFPTQIVKTKVVSVNDAGWVNVSLSPHLFGTISPNHLANSNLSKENIDAKFKPGTNLKVNWF